MNDRVWAISNLGIIHGGLVDAKGPLACVNTSLGPVMVARDNIFHSRSDVLAKYRTELEHQQVRIARQIHEINNEIGVS